MRARHTGQRVVAIFALIGMLASCGQGQLGGMIGSALVKKPAASRVVTLGPNGQRLATITARIDAGGAATTLEQSGRNGDVVTWTSLDQRTVSFRRGVLVASRGLGFDLMAAEVSGTLAAFGRGGSYERRMRYLDGNNQPVILSFSCIMAPPVAESIVVAAKPIAVSASAETCTSGGTEFTNHYWLVGGNVVKSTEWISSNLGYLTTEQAQS